MGIFDKCLLVLDIDDTLVYEGKIPKRNLEAIEYFKAEGGQVTLATGRAAVDSRNVYFESGCNAPLIAVCGAVVYDYNSDTALFRKQFSRQSKQLIADLGKKYQQVGLLIYCDDKMYILNTNETVEDILRFKARMGEFVDVKKVIDKEWTKVVFIDNNIGKYEADIFKSAETVTDDEVCFIKTDPKFIELSYKNVSKATGIRWLLKNKYQGYKVFAAGNYFNDLPMLEFADVSCCPEESVSQIKNVCDFIGSNCSLGTVADFIEYLKDKNSN